MSNSREDLMAPEVDVQRIMRTATIWFSAAVLADALVMGLVLASGWRPALLSEGLAIFWWASALVHGISIGLLAWSGCPILEVSVPVANRNKSKSMQLGTLLFIVSGAAVLLALLLSPAVG